MTAGDGTPQLDGVDASLVSTVTRTDGSKQLAIGGLPLYLFAQDTKAGEAKGQAVGGVWWVVGADGKKITTQPSRSAMATPATEALGPCGSPPLPTAWIPYRTDGG